MFREDKPSSLTLLTKQKCLDFSHLFEDWFKKRDWKESLSSTKNSLIFRQHNFAFPNETEECKVKTISSQYNIQTLTYQSECYSGNENKI